ncbi:hypothetical protein ES705_24162 [subsurface metagenome]
MLVEKTFVKPLTIELPKVSLLLSAKLTARDFPNVFQPCSSAYPETADSIHGSRNSSSNVSDMSILGNWSNPLATPLPSPAIAPAIAKGRVLITVTRTVYAASLNFCCVFVAIVCWYIYSKILAWADCMVAMFSTSSAVRSRKSSIDLYFSMKNSNTKYLSTPSKLINKLSKEFFKEGNKVICPEVLLKVNISLFSEFL